MEEVEIRGRGSAVAGLLPIRDTERAYLIFAEMLRTAARAANGLKRFSTLGSESFLSGTSSVYIEEMYAAYKRAPGR